MKLKGTKLGCGLEQCGSCTVLVDGQKTLSCNQNALDFVDKQIITIEGLKQDNQLSIIQEAFIEFNAAQCGFCTTGIIMAVTSLFNENNNPKIKTIKTKPNHRCGSHASILRAVEKVKRNIKER